VLTAKELGKVERALRAGPAAHGWHTELWTLARVADVIAMETGVRYHIGHLWKILRRLGWSWQKPARRAIERDEEEITRWVREESGVSPTRCETHVQMVTIAARQGANRVRSQRSLLLGFLRHTGLSSFDRLVMLLATLAGSVKAPEPQRQIIQRGLGPPRFVALEECADLVEVVRQREGQHPPRPPIALAVPAVCVEKAPEQGGIRAEGPEVDDHQVVVGVEQPNVVEVEHADRSDLAWRSIDVDVARVQVTVGERRRVTVEDEGAGRGQEAVEVVQQVSGQDSSLTVLLRAALQASGEEARRLESTDRRLDPMHSPQEVAEKGRDTQTVRRGDWALVERPAGQHAQDAVRPAEQRRPRKQLSGGQQGGHGQPVPAEQPQGAGLDGPRVSIRERLVQLDHDWSGDRHHVHAGGHR
jgi:hypothetical protein